MQTLQGINWHFTKWVIILARRSIFRIVNHDNQEGLLKSSKWALAAQWKQLYLAAVWLLQDDWKSRCNSALYISQGTALCFHCCQWARELKSVLKQRNSFIETCWNSTENTWNQFRSVWIRRFIASFLIQFEMDRESEQSAQDLTQDPEPYNSRAAFVGGFLSGLSEPANLPC